MAGFTQRLGLRLQVVKERLAFVACRVVAAMGEQYVFELKRSTPFNAKANRFFDGRKKTPLRGGGFVLKGVCY